MKMLPHLKHFRTEESGIKRVVLAYHQHLPKFDIELVDPEDHNFDVSVAHAGMAGGEPQVSMLHGLYWTADYHADAWEWRANASVIESIRSAKQVTVPSEWVAETLRRDMHLDPHVVPHGIDYHLWNSNADNQGYILWNKNRAGIDVCSPEPLGELAKRFPDKRFLSTFAPNVSTPNIKATGLVKHDMMKRMVEHANVYLASVKETFGIGILESMAAGVPVLGFRQGGVCDIVRHGVEGYLAEPNNYDDLAEGLNYCLKYRQVLSANARERAKAFTWEAVASQVAGIFRQAAEPDDPSVAVIIPCYNYGHTLQRAVNSVLEQTYPVKEIIIVDDGSTDNTQAVATALAQTHNNVRYVRQSNAGVAHARNAGIAASSAKYICCVDADDQIKPRFIEACVAELESNRSLGIAYTRLQWVKPDGSTGLSQWPGAFSYDDQLKRRNQIPTACVFRRDMWASLGGYRQRYAPTGAGSEDAEFWTRAGAYGWGAKLATEEALFVYSWMSGHTSKDGYHETDWLDKPWVADGLHPFASVATPKKWSHPVRQYDSPVVSVVIPVGEGHEQFVYDALDSLEHQSFRQWEAIVVWDSPESADDLIVAFPFIKLLRSYERGAGVARNMGAKVARAPFLLFLDADDMLHMRCIESMLDAWESTEAIVYSDYYGSAHVEDVDKLSDKQKRRIVSRNEKTNETIIMHEAFDYDWRRAQRQPETPQPYIWCNVTCLIPTVWHNEIGGFDEDMKSWEDVDYHYRMAQHGKPYVRIPEPLMTYKFWSGNRREDGLQNYKYLIEYLKTKYEGVELMPCTSCGKSRHSAPPPMASNIITRGMMAVEDMSDDNYVMVRLVDNRKEDHFILGHVTKNRYYKKHGDVFLMHRDDIAAQPHIYELSVKAEMVVPQVTAPAPIPEPVAAIVNDSMNFVQNTWSDEEYERRVQGAWMVSESEPSVESVKEMDSILRIDKPSFDLQLIPGITSNIAQQLVGAGVNSLESLAEWNTEKLMALKGVGEAKAELIQEYVREKLK